MSSVDLERKKRIWRNYMFVAQLVESFKSTEKFVDFSENDLEIFERYKQHIIDLQFLSKNRLELLKIVNRLNLEKSQHLRLYRELRQMHDEMERFSRLIFRLVEDTDRLSVDILGCIPQTIREKHEDSGDE